MRDYVTRRRVLAVTGAAVAGVGAVATGTRDAQAQTDVEMGELSASGDTAQLAAPPESIRIDATGEWRIETAGSVEQVQLTLQARVGDGRIDELDSNTVFDDPTSGTFDLGGDLIDDHRDTEASAFMPAGPGETRERDVEVRIVVAAVRDGEVVSEGSVEDTATLEISESGVAVRVGASADVTINSDG